MLLTVVQIFLLGIAALHGQYARNASAAEQAERAMLAGTLQLTDLCLFTEARYTRHPAMADLHSAFQDHPNALEHFPSGSLVTPPLKRTDAGIR